MTRPARASAPVHVAVPSKGRAGKVRTQAVLPSCHVYVPALEASAYRVAGARNVVPVPDTVRGITKTRNWILAHAPSSRVVMIDDDVLQQGYIKLHSHQAQNVRLDEAAWALEFVKLFDVTTGLGFRAWGVATDGATRSVYPFYPFRFRSYITASCMGIVNDGRTKFDESYPVKEDYELCARLIREDGGVLSAQYLHWVNSHFRDPGGCRDYRTIAVERDCISRLSKAYPGVVRVAHRLGNEVSIEIV
jgi:hypothetical protein